MMYIQVQVAEDAKGAFLPLLERGTKARHVLRGLFGNGPPNAAQKSAISDTVSYGSYHLWRHPWNSKLKMDSMTHALIAASTNVPSKQAKTASS